jgi:hypothetical protein
MSKLFGRRACEEETDWEVRVYFNDDGDYLTLTEQVTQKEAELFYDDFKKELEASTTGWVEVEVTDKVVLLNKDNITMVRLMKN